MDELADTLSLSSSSALGGYYPSVIFLLDDADYLQKSSSGDEAPVDDNDQFIAELDYCLQHCTAAINSGSSSHSQLLLLR